MPIAPIGPGGQPLLMRLMPEFEDPNLPDPGFDPGALEISSPVVLSHSGYVTPGTVISVVAPTQYLLDGEPVVPVVVAREWVTEAGTVDATGDSYTAVTGRNIYYRERVLHPDTGEAWPGPLDTTATITVGTFDPSQPPPQPAPSDWTILDSVYNPGQSADFKPLIEFSGPLAAAGVTVQWSSYYQFPAPEQYFEPFVETATPGRFVTSHKDGLTSQWAAFREGEVTRRTQQFRVRYRIGDGPWSPESAIKVVPLPAPPQAPTAVTAAASATAGRVDISATAPTQWGGASVTGVVQYALASTGPWIAMASYVDFLPAQYGSSKVIWFSALSAAGVRSTPVAAPAVTVPGTPPATTRKTWARFHMRAPGGRDKSGDQVQFCHGGDRSTVNPNHVAFIMDVAHTWVTTTAENQFPAYHLTAGKGLRSSLSVAVKWDGLNADTLFYAAGQVRNDSDGQDRGGGLYLSTDRGESYTRVISLHYDKNGNDWLRSGSIENEKWRSWMHLIDFDPSNKGTVWFFAPLIGLYKSSNRTSWTRISNDPRPTGLGGLGMDRCNYLKVTPGGQVLWAACQNGLWKSTNGGVNWALKQPTGLLNGFVSNLAFNPADHDEFYACVYGQGVFKTTDGGESFTKLSTPHNNVAQIHFTANRQHIWLLGWRALNGRSFYSSNGGTNWSEFTTDHNTYGWENDNTFFTNIEARGAPDKNRQTVILPSPITPGKALATAGCALWSTANGKDWINSSDGYSNRAGGVQQQSFSWAPGGRMYLSTFDYTGTASTDGGQTWRDVQFKRPPFYSIVGNAASINPLATNKIMVTLGKYNSVPIGLIVSTDFGATAANSFRPSFFSSNWNDYERTPWCGWHGQEVDTAYCTHGISTDGGVDWKHWTDQETDGNEYKTHIGRAGIIYDNDGPNRLDRRGVIARSPSNGDVIWATNLACNKVLRSTNKGVKWTKVADTGPEVWGEDVVGHCAHPTDDKQFWWWVTGIGLTRWNNGSVQVSTGTEQIKGLTVVRIAIDYQNPNVCYLMNYEVFTEKTPRCGVFRSTSGFNGPFVEITDNLPDTVANRTLEVDPYRGIVFIAGVAGLYCAAPPSGSTVWEDWYDRWGAA